MSSKVWVLHHPFFDVVDEGTGTFTIENVPAGPHRLRAWHPLWDEVTIDVEVRGGETTTVEVELGTSD